MKKLALNSFILAFLLFTFSLASAQVSTTPNLGLSIINPGTQNWGPIVNQNFVILDSKVVTLNLSCADGQVPGWAAGKFSICVNPANVDQAANYNWTGTHAFTKALTITGKQVCLADGTNCPSAGKETDPVIAALNGFVVSNGTTPAARSLATANVSNITITNLTGAGNPTWDVGPNVALTSRSFTLGNFDFDLGGAASFTMPKATGGTTTVEGRIITNTTTHRAIFGNGTAAKIFAFTDEIQPLNANLTALSGLTNTANKLIGFNGTNMSLISGLESPCIDSGGQHLNLVSTSPPLFGCGTSSTGGISGLTTGKLSKAASATTLTDSIISEAAGVATVGGGLVVGTGPYLIFNTAAITPSDITWTALNFSGTIRPSTGAITAGHNITVDANGLLVDNGAAGSGTWTDSSTSTGTNKTLVATGAGGTNTITTPIFASFDGGALTPDGTNCTDPTKTTINSGPTQYSFVCPTPNSAIFDAVIIGIKQAVATIRVRLKANDTASTQSLAGTFKAQCRASGTAPSSTWGTTQTVSITLTTLNTTYEGLTTAITPNGTCSAGSDLYIRYNATGGSNSATTRILGLLIEQLS